MENNRQENNDDPEDPEKEDLVPDDQSKANLKNTENDQEDMAPKKVIDSDRYLGLLMIIIIFLTFSLFVKNTMRYTLTLICLIIIFYLSINRQVIKNFQAAGNR